MGIAITVRDVPERVRDELAARARRSGRSLQEYLRAMLVDASEQEDVLDVMSRIRARKAATGTHVRVEEILEHLEAERRS